MLTELTIRNFAIIDELKVNFSEGLNIITGETGAGKSIIINAVALLLGDRASTDLIRTGEEMAQVEAIFDLRRHEEAKKILSQWEMEVKDEVIVRRVVSRAGKSRAYINGAAATTSQLSLLGEVLLNICGQHEHQLLLEEENHIAVLDAYAGIGGLVEAYGTLFNRVSDLDEKIKRLLELKNRRAEMRELFEFQRREIEEADPRPGEDERLLEEKRVLTNVQRLRELAAGIYEELYGKEGSALEKVRRALYAIEDIKKIDPRFAPVPEDVQGIYYQLEDVALYARSYSQNLSLDEERLAEIEERLERLNRLKKKYGGSIEAVLSRRESLIEELKKGETLEVELDERKKEREEAYRELEDRAREISHRRKEAALRLEKELNQELHTLMMTGAKFSVHMEETGLTRWGRDVIAFMFTANPGEELKPLQKVASGGELSRLMLALKKVLADRGFAGTIIFDEVDSGIGGATAEVVGEKIEEVARYNQVICITHLPQIARFAHRHYRVEKRVIDGKTVTAINELKEAERREELARMLGGKEITSTTLKHASEMLAARRKKGGSGAYVEKGQG
ncbi:MAG TPA: DNA repair protein RecN [Syntrophales bacterium]|nr:DNA repair protein RecN [Syntrophales bacterium]HOL58475.1 DNA repair protein RecN [Syntrophales bacterium]HPO34917.1 DNA repair protein RecN [Syntrophales bacterium]